MTCPSRDNCEPSLGEQPLSGLQPGSWQKASECVEPAQGLRASVQNRPAAPLLTLVNLTRDMASPVLNRTEKYDLPKARGAEYL